VGRAAVVGSANVDHVVRVPHLPLPGETVLGSAYAQHMGGKGANEAVAASRLGADVFFIGAVGTDAGGALAVASDAGGGGGAAASAAPVAAIPVRYQQTIHALMVGSAA